VNAAPGEAVLRRRGLYMLPTRHGLTFAAILMVLLLCAINYGNSLAYGLTFLLAAAAVVSMLYTDRNLLYLRVRAGASLPVFAGSVAIFRLHLINDKTIQRYGVALMHAKQEIARTDVGATASAALELHVPTMKRGWLAMPAFHLKTQYPLGILYSWTRPITLAERCLIYPRPSEPWAWHTQADTEIAASVRPGASGDDFSGVREYRPGDSPRQIDWKSMARGRGLLTKEFSAGLSERLWFDLSRIPGPDTETRLSMACRAVLEAEQSGFRYGLRLGNTVIEPDSGEQHEQTCLRALALYGQKE
jgi:uncharacterized protein (DUF58 family)